VTTALRDRVAKERQRLDAVALRWQARLDTDWSDRVLPWLVAGVLALVLIALALARVRSLDAGEDLGFYTQGAWLIDKGVDPIVTIKDGHNLLALQAAFSFYPLAFLTRFLPIIPTLVVVQSIVLALGVVPLWRIGRRVANLRVGAAGTLVFAYAFYPAVHNLNLADFHPETLALPGLLAAAYFGLTRRWILFATFCVISVLSRADLGLAVAGFGALFALEGERRPAIITAVAGLGWTTLAVLVIQPGFGGGSYAHVDSFMAYGDTPISIAGGLLTHPLTVIGDLVVEENFAVLVFLLAPVLFLPVLAPRYLLPVLPLEIMYLIADVPESSVFAQQTIAITAFVFLATAMALSRIGTMGVEQIRVDRRVLGAVILASTVFFIRDAASSPYRTPWNWGGRDAADHARIEATDLVPPDAAVRASPELLPLLAERSHVYLLDTDGPPQVRQAVARVDVIVFDTAAAEDWSDDDLRVFRDGLRRQGFERTYNKEGIEIFVRQS
jgi:uncharacterized membrane protein